MKEKGYIYKDDNPIMIDESNPMVKTFVAKKGLTDKILELTCPNGTIISACGKTHEGGCEKSYLCDIKCFDKNNKELFHGLHYSTKLGYGKHVLVEIIVTKTLYNEPDKSYKKVQEWSEFINPILKMIGSENPCEHVMWIGAYQLFNTEFLNTSFNIYENQKMTFYAVNPDTDVEKVEFKLNADILEKQV